MMRQSNMLITAKNNFMSDFISQAEVNNSPHKIAFHPRKTNSVDQPNTNHHMRPSVNLKKNKYQKVVL